MFGSEALVQGYVAFLGSFVTVFAAAYAVYAMQTLRTEEDSGRTDAVLATPVSRVGWSAAHMVTIALGVLLISVITGLGTGIAAAGVTGDGALVREILASHLAVVPAALGVLGLSAALYGWIPRAMPLLGGPVSR